MIALICGGRAYHDMAAFAAAMHRFQDECGQITHVIHGGAMGADTLADIWARTHKIPVTVYHAKWDAGPWAGPLRNTQMLKEGKPHVVIATPGGAGTFDMISKAEKAGVPVRRIP